MSRTHPPLPGAFEDPEGAFDTLDPAATARLIRAAVDIALVIDPTGIIQDLALSLPEAAHARYRDWIGQPWVDTVTDESRTKVELLLEQAAADRQTRPSEVNHRAPGAPDLPVRYSAVRLDAGGRVLALGRDLRAFARMQQQLVGAQQAMEREYTKLRHAETRYRLLFQIAQEAVLIVDATQQRIVEANPAAARLVEVSDNDQLIGRALAKAFTPATWSKVQAQLSAVAVSGWADEVRAQLAAGAEVAVRASLFRQGAASMLLVRLMDAGAGPAKAADDRSRSLFQIVGGMPDAFVIVDGDRRIMHANPAFLELVELASEPQVLGQPLDSWVGRPGVDLKLLLASLREHGVVRNFATVVYGQYGSTEQAEVSGVAARHEDEACYGFVIRAVSPDLAASESPGASIESSVDHLTELVGRVSLKEIIRETTDTIERRCIEAALEVSGDNRASAAQLLGLSRQSLYAKLRRYGLQDPDPGDDTG